MKDAFIFRDAFLGIALWFILYCGGVGFSQMVIYTVNLVAPQHNDILVGIASLPFYLCVAIPVTLRARHIWNID